MIEIDPDVFTFQPERDMSHERFVVTDVQDTGAVVEALTRASERFMLVDTEGVEYESNDELLAGGEDSPSYVSDPEVKGDRVELYVDSKGVIPDGMATTMRGILQEELGAVGYQGQVSVATGS